MVTSQYPNDSDTRGDNESCRDGFVNDFSLVIAARYGYIAQAVLVRALLRMGIPARGQSLFASVVDELLTRYTIRVGGHGYTEGQAASDIALLLNPDTAAREMQSLRVGGVCFLPEEWEQANDMLVYYPLPVMRILEDAGTLPYLYDRAMVMVFIGAVAHNLGIRLDDVHYAVTDLYGDRDNAIAANFVIVQRAYAWAVAHLNKRDPFRAARPGE